MDLAADDLLGTVLVRDCLEAEGGFLLVQLIKTALSAPADGAQRRLVLLAAQHATSHYAAVLRKAGLSLPVLVEAGRLAVVDLLPFMGAVLPTLQQVQQQLAAAATAAGAASSGRGHGVATCVLVADDLSVLHCLASSPADWAAFLQACTSVGQAPGCCFVGLAHSGVEDDEGWLARLEHAATLVLDVEPLESGRSIDTTGRLAITRRVARGMAAAPDAIGSAAPGSRVCSYKLVETGASYVQHVM